MVLGKKLVVCDLSIGSTETKYIKLNTKTFDFCIHFKRENFFSPSVFLSPLSKCTKQEKFSFKQKKIFWVLVFSFIYLVSVDPMYRS